MRAIWDRYKVHFYNDLACKLAYNLSIDFPLPLVDPYYNYGLFLLGLGLTDLQRTLTDVALPENTFNWTVSHRTADLRVDCAHETLLATVIQAQLNMDQCSCFQTIMAAVTDNAQTAYFYL
jgi:hypothetical protein